MSDGIDGLRNFRDVGGLPVAGGGRARQGILFRGGALSGLSDQGLQELAASPIGVIVDLRTPRERQLAPDAIPTLPDGSQLIATVEHPLLEGSMGAVAGPDAGGTSALVSPTGDLPSLGDIYLLMLSHAAADFAAIATLIANPPNPQRPAVLVHCTAGKDRTGVAVAVLLDAIGVERSAIVADYTATQKELSGAWAEGILAMIPQLGIPVTPEIAEIATGAPAAAIERALAWVDDAGGARAYLAGGGLDADAFAKLREAMVS